MKNQYFGDVNDYRKYGLLRALQAPACLSLSVGWMLTPDDGSIDGRFRRYLREPGNWRHHDPLLFDHLSSVLTAGDAPCVAMVEQAAVLPETHFFSDIVPDDRLGRERWSERLVDSSDGADLVFLDPDNGFEVPSKPVGRKGSNKYVLWSAVERLWEAGSSVLVYQHYCREPRRPFATRLAGEMRRRTGAGFVEGFSTSHVFFLLTAQPRHVELLREAILKELPRWHGQITTVGLSAD
ncbi:MAG: hypothetical protein KKA32_08765 [Actinobacteria bacterium]|nr:hypothetical protein [Actinomycetota bacterium]